MWYIFLDLKIIKEQVLCARSKRWKPEMCSAKNIRVWRPRAGTQQSVAQVFANERYCRKKNVLKSSRDWIQKSGVVKRRATICTLISTA